ncbi:MAG: Gfo/Idh/MocA family oxidoreductase [Candidatus Aminicenantes bacterium]|nr:Gfo/Idh/MocA family oxidoreductase [Candidatus Aminicenantes bacterium]
MNKINVGVVGLGWWGPKLVKNFRKHPLVDKVYGWDISEKAVENALNSGLLFEPVRRQDDLFRDEISSLIIATPPKTHFSYAQAALERGKHVLVTKPPVETKAELDLLASLIKEKKLTFMVDATYVFNPGLENIVSLARERGFQNLRLLRIVRFGDVLRLRHKNRLVQTMFANKVNIIKDLIFHDLSVLCSLFPGDITVESVEEFRNLDEECSDSAVLILRAENIPVLIEYSWIYPERKSEYQFYYHDHFLIFDDFSPGDKVWEFTYDNQQRRAFPVESAEPLFRVVDHFLSCIASGKEPRTGIEFAKKVMVSTEKINRTMERRR